jgi:Tfp pilus assembly protein PilZ
MSRTTLRERRHARIRTRIRVSYGIGVADRSGLAESISEGGLYINTNDAYKVGTPLVLRIDFPERTVVQRGEVVWAIRVPEHLRESMVCGIGVSFVDPDPDWLAFFHRWRDALDARR